jgi:hypothetical protein
MDHFEMQISHFRETASNLIKIRVIELNKFKHSHLISGKLVRIKIFNAQLDILKKELNEGLRQILNENKGSTDYPQLEKALSKVYDEYINEYMCVSFIKDE